jgi:hypothetical protein
MKEELLFIRNSFEKDGDYSHQINFFYNIINLVLYWNLTNYFKKSSILYILDYPILSGRAVEIHFNVYLKKKTMINKVTILSSFL